MSERDPFWRTESPRGPTHVENGLVARSTRGAIGSSWWSKRFLAVLESASFDVGGRLTRGRAYARKGQVVSLEVAPGLVTSVVQGSRPTPYRTRIELAVLDDRQWAAVVERLRSQALFAARLLAGELPAELEDVVEDAGAHLFPTDRRQVRTTCSCPDVADPCKHLAATFYLLAESFDEDPWRILLWRGRSREALLAELDLADDAGGSGEADDADRRLPVGTASALDGLTFAEAAPDRFWSAPLSPGTRPPVLDAPADLLLRQLPPPPAAIGGAVLRAWLREAYAALARRAQAQDRT